MNKLILALAAILSLPACTTTSIVGGLAAQQTAPVAREILAQYIGDDEIAISNLIGPVNSLQHLLDKSQDIDSAQAFFEFFQANQAEILIASRSWQQIVNAVGEYAQRTKRPVPQQLITYRADVEAAWRELGQAISSQSKILKAEKYVALLAKLVAANAGIIL